jgi:hypothetical protein
MATRGRSSAPQRPTREACAQHMPVKGTAKMKETSRWLAILGLLAACSSHDAQEEEGHAEGSDDREAQSDDTDRCGGPARAA